VGQSNHSGGKGGGYLSQNWGVNKHKHTDELFHQRKKGCASSTRERGGVNLDKWWGTGSQGGANNLNLGVVCGRHREKPSCSDGDSPTAESGPLYEKVDRLEGTKEGGGLILLTKSR